MYNKLDFCFFEILFATYGLIILAFGAECNRKFLTYGNSSNEYVHFRNFFAVFFSFYLIVVLPNFCNWAIRRTFY